MDFTGSPRKKTSKSFAIYEDDSAGYEGPVSALRNHLSTSLHLTGLLAWLHSNLWGSSSHHFTIRKPTPTTTAQNGKGKLFLFCYIAPLLTLLEDGEGE